MSELSVLSREDSSGAGGAGNVPDGGSGPAAAAASAAALAAVPMHMPAAGRPAPQSGEASPSEDEWLLQQQLMHGTGLHSSSGGSASASDGPPEFF